MVHWSGRERSQEPRGSGHYFGTSTWGGKHLSKRVLANFLNFSEADIQDSLEFVENEKGILLMPPTIRTFPDAEAVSRGATEEFIRCAREAIAARGRFTVTLSGGSTPK